MASSPCIHLHGRGNQPHLMKTSGKVSGSFFRVFWSVLVGIPPFWNGWQETGFAASLTLNMKLSVNNFRIAALFLWRYFSTGSKVWFKRRYLLCRVIHKKYFALRGAGREFGCPNHQKDSLLERQLWMFGLRVPRLYSIFTEIVFVGLYSVSLFLWNSVFFWMSSLVLV